MEEASNQPPTDVDQLMFREMTSDFAEEVSEGRSDKLADSLGASVGNAQLCFEGVRVKERVKRVSGPKNLPREDSGRITETECGGEQEELLRGPRGRAQGNARVEERSTPRKALNATCAEGLDTPRGFDDLEQDALEGEDTNEDECGTEEDDETLQLGYLGSESCLMRSPPGLSDAFSEAGWTVVTRKLRNRQQCSRRHGCCDKRGTVLGSLWDDDNDMILGQVAHGRTRKEKVQISTVVDVSAEANALPENMMQWIPLKPSSASKSGKIFRGAGGDPIPAQDERSVTGRTEEGQSRRIVWEVCPVKRPLLSVATITKAGNQVYLGEDKAFVKNNKWGRSQTSVESARCGCSTCG